MPRRPRRPLFQSQRTAIAVGLVLLAVSFYVLYDAWDGRGRKKPLVFGPILPW
jgi:hypothetical protein